MKQSLLTQPKEQEQSSLHEMINEAMSSSVSSTKELPSTRIANVYFLVKNVSLCGCGSNGWTEVKIYIEVPGDSPIKDGDKLRSYLDKGGVWKGKGWISK